MTNRFIPVFAAAALMLSAAGAFATEATSTDANAPAATNTAMVKSTMPHKKHPVSKEHKAVWTKCRSEHKNDKKAIRECVKEHKMNMNQKAPAKN